MNQQYISAAARPSTLATNKLIRNTYLLLSMTLLFSVFTAWASMQLKVPSLGIFLTLGGYFGLLFLTTKFRNSALGLVFVFALTGFMGVTLGPMLSYYLTAFSNGHSLVMTAFGGTAVIFLGLSGYALTSRKDFSFMTGALLCGILVAFLAGLGAYAFNLPGLSLAVSAAFVLLASGLILWETSNIVHGHETNYIMATVTLFVALFNLFTSLLHLLGAFSGDD